MLKRFIDAIVDVVNWPWLSIMSPPQTEEADQLEAWCTITITRYAASPLGRGNH